MLEVDASSECRNNCAVIFGGTGFIGAFFAEYLLKNFDYKKVYLVDLQAINELNSPFRQKQLNNSAIEILQGDVRKPLDWLQVYEHVDLVANFAAIHREPGHYEEEYYETNINGALNVCAWAESVSCQTILFSSSIAPYGSSGVQKDELSTPVPSTAYGGSKLVAENIHKIWQARDQKDRRLVIVRPGVVFGPSEGGNVSRLIRAVLKKYFVYMGNKTTKKAGVYVKELCNAMGWVISNMKKTDGGVVTFNMTMEQIPSIEDYVVAIMKVAKIQRAIPSIPYPLLLLIAYFFEIIAKPFKLTHPISPVRIRKLRSSNNIRPGYLIENNYTYVYSLEEALLDWKLSNPSDWQ